MADFKRARHADQKNARRQELLRAASELFDDGGPLGAGINAIAAHAGFTKSNVYRYFESREHVLLALFLEEFANFAGEATAELGRLPPCGPSDVGATITNGFASRPRLCKLAAVFGSMLEQNVSVGAIEDVKRTLANETGPLVEAMARSLPGSNVEDCGWAFAMIISLLAGMWPGASPSPATAQVLAKPEFAGMLLTLDVDFRRGVTAILASVATSPSREAAPDRMAARSAPAP